MKFMFYAPHTLADSCSGAARCMQTLFEELVRLGHLCKVVTGTVVDGPSELLDKVMAAPPTQTIDIGGSNIKIPARRVNYNAVDHLMIGDAPTMAAQQKAYVDVVLKSIFAEHFDAFQPDVLLTYGGFSSNFFAGQYAMMRGRRSVLFGASGSYNRPADFCHVNLIVTVSGALSAELAKFTPLPMVTLKPFVKKADILCAQRAPEYITFINPTFGKGLKLVAALAAESQRRGKPYKFLIVESRATRTTALQDCPELAACTNVMFAANAANITAIYEKARVLLFPSVWFETAGRVVIEANANRIPVLASNVGGVAEMLDGAGYLFDPPQIMRDNWDAAPPADYLESWLAALDSLHNDPAEWDSAISRTEAADKRYDTTALARRFIAAVGG